MFNPNEFLIDRVLRAHMFDFDGRRRWTASQITDPVLECAGETVFSTDALGSNIMAFERSKNATFTCNNALMNIPMLADQIGSEVETATEQKKQVFTCFEFIEVNTDGAAATLTHTPYEEVSGVPFKYIDKVDGNGATEATYELGTAAESNFSVKGSTITLPTGAGLKAGDRLAVRYKFETATGASIENIADHHSEYGEFMIEVLAYSPCDTATKCALNIIFPNSKPDNNVSLTLTNELSHPLSVSAMPRYCDTNKKLFRIEMLSE